MKTYIKPNLRKHKLQNLLQDTNEAYYWIGFLLADGYFSNRGAIKLHLCENDTDQVQKYASFVEYVGNSKPNIVYCHAPEIVENIRKKFLIVDRKTYNPPDFKTILKDKSDDLVLSLIIGYIDGDGCILKLKNRIDCNISIKCHGSWINNLQFISNFIGNHCNLVPNSAHINNKGYAVVFFSNCVLLKYLKNKGINLNLPVMNRKWDKIDLNFISKQENSGINKIAIKQMLLDGFSKTEIAKKLNVLVNTVIVYIWRNKDYFKDVNYCGKRKSKGYKYGKVD